MVQGDLECMSAEEVLRHYLYRLQGAGGKGQFTRRFMSIMGGPRGAREAMNYYLRILQQVTLPQAEELTDWGRSSTLRDALGVGSPDELVTCAVLTLHLRPGDRRCADVYRDYVIFDEARVAGVQTVRRKILETCRTHLMAEPQINFLAAATLDGEEGHGVGRIGGYGYTHFAREALFFALLASLARDPMLFLRDVHAALAAVGPGHDLAPAQRSECLLVLLRAVFGPIEGMLAKFASRDTYYRPRSEPEDDNWNPADRARDPRNAGGPEVILGECEAGDDIGSPENPWEQGDLAHAIAVVERETEGVEVRMAQAQDAATRARLAVSREALRHEHARLHELWDRSRPSEPLLPAATDALLYDAVLRCVVDAAEALPDAKTITCRSKQCRSKQCRARDYFRLRFAAQLISFWAGHDYTHKRRQWIAEDLSTEFKETADEEIGDALACFMRLDQGNDVWGDPHRRLLDRLVKQCLEYDWIPERQRCEELMEHVHEALNAALRAGIELERPPTLGDVGALIELLCQVEDRRDELAAPSRWHPGLADRLTALRELEAVLIERLLADATATMHALFEELLPLVGARLSDGRWSVERLKKLEGILLEYWKLQASDPEELQREINRSRDLRRLYRLSQITLELIAKFCKPQHQERLLAEHVPDPRKVRRFFTQTYSPHGTKGVGNWSRLEWEFVAFRLYAKGSWSPYAHVYERVSRRLAGIRAADVRGLYRELMDTPDFVPACKAVLRQCLCRRKGAQPC